MCLVILIVSCSYSSIIFITPSFIYLNIVLVYSDYFNKNIINWVNKNNKHLFSRVLIFKALEDSVSDKDPLFRWWSFHSNLTKHKVQTIWGLFYKGTNPIVRVLPLWPNHFPTAPHPNTLGLGFNIWI